jgi:hypothetical protein
VHEVLGPRPSALRLSFVAIVVAFSFAKYPLLLGVALASMMPSERTESLAFAALLGIPTVLAVFIAMWRYAFRYAAFNDSATSIVLVRYRKAIGRIDPTDVAGLVWHRITTEDPVVSFEMVDGVVHRNFACTDPRLDALAPACLVPWWVGRADLVAITAFLVFGAARMMI